MILSQRDRCVLANNFDVSTLERMDQENQRVQMYAARLLEVYEWNIGAQIPNTMKRDIEISAYLHDLGKLCVPSSILNKPDSLTSDEFNVMKHHTISGASMLSSLPDLRRTQAYPYACDVCRHHHERWNGAEYPDGQTSNEISCWSQLVALADVYDALTSERPYKPAYSHEKAMEMICSGQCGCFSRLMLDCLMDAQNQFHIA